MIRNKILKLYTVSLILISLHLGIYCAINYEFNVLCNALAFLLCAAFPFVLNKYIRNKMRNSLIFSIVTFNFIGLFLGGGINLYAVAYWWDIVVHTLSGILFFQVGFWLTNNMKITKLQKLIFILLIVMAAALTWEIIEFIGDSLFKTNLQEWQTDTYEPFVPLVHERGHGLVDSMLDMINAIVGYFYALIISYIKNSLHNTRKNASKK